MNNRPLGTISSFFEPLAREIRGPSEDETLRAQHLLLSPLPQQRLIAAAFLGDENKALRALYELEKRYPDAAQLKEILTQSNFGGDAYTHAWNNQLSNLVSKLQLALNGQRHPDQKVSDSALRATVDAMHMGQNGPSTVSLI